MKASLLGVLSVGWLPASDAGYGRCAAPRLLLDDGGAACSLALNAKAAFAASALATALLHPIDTLKTRLQSDAYTVSQTASPIVLRRKRPQPEAPPAPRLTTGLYTGLQANVLKEAPDAAVFLMISEELSRSLSVSSPWFASHLTLTLMLSGAVGDAAGSVLRLPAEVLCKRLQTTGPAGDDGGLAGWSRLLADTNLDCWKASWAAILVRDVPFGGLQIAAYQEAKQLLAELRGQLHELGSDLGEGVSEIGAEVSGLVAAAGLPPLWSDAYDMPSELLAGVLAGALSAALTTPLDVLVTHATTQDAPADGSPPRGAVELGVDLVREQGALTLLRGLTYRTLYYAPLVGVFFGLYEHFKRLLG